MPLCPNCGSWVPEGEPTCSCGASLGSYYTQNVDSKEIEEKIMKDIRRNREKRLRKEAAHLADQGRYAEAIERYKKALDVN